MNKVKTGKSFQNNCPSVKPVETDAYLWVSGDSIQVVLISRFKLSVSYGTVHCLPKFR